MKNSKYIIIGLLILAITTVGATYAFFTATVSSSNKVNSSSADFKVLYTGGTEITGDLKLLTSKDGASNTTVHIRMDNGSVLASANLYINIENISREIAASAFKWEVVGVKNSTTVYTNSGTFNGTSNNGKIKIVSNYALDYTNTDFTVYFWLDKDTVENAMLGKTFSGYISAETEHYTGSIKS